MWVSVWVWVCLWVEVPEQSATGVYISSFGARVNGGCELPDVGTGCWTLVARIVSLLTAEIPQFFFFFKVLFPTFTGNSYSSIWRTLFLEGFPHQVSLVVSTVDWGYQRLRVRNQQCVSLLCCQGHICRLCFNGDPIFVQSVYQNLTLALLFLDWQKWILLLCNNISKPSPVSD